ncbi:Protein-ADP-ribose hydrolase [Streptococcus salivarius]|nr:Protein-ADP-ribose hydrolase [Streptococcus salivarius]VUW82027.1 Protein-ADP-ribose hydrolase [Streptococcus thermophilus]
MDKDAMITYLIGELKKENLELHDLIVPEELEKKQRLLRALFNTRKPMAASTQFLTIQDLYLQVRKGERGIVQLNTLRPISQDDQIYIWKGDITKLEVDAIVNAANKTLLGCMKPLHDCVDNAIHTYAGVQLRQSCYELILEQGYEEPVGMAKITPAYNLPSAFVIHTVGPKIENQPTQIDEDLLAKCYLSALALAEKNNIESIAIPCISTGDFNFPKQKAATIAIQTVKDFIKDSTTVKKVIFNVFDDDNLSIYQELLTK